MWTTREIDGVARALREVADALAEASSEAKSRDARRARDDDDDEDDGPALGAVRGATLAGNCAVKLREALERVEAHAGEAFRDVEGATKAAAVPAVRARASFMIEVSARVDASVTSGPRRCYCV